MRESSTRLAAGTILETVLGDLSASGVEGAAILLVDDADAASAIRPTMPSTASASSRSLIMSPTRKRRKRRWRRTTSGCRWRCSASKYVDQP